MSQHQTVPSTSNGTSEKSSLKKRRTRGPNKPKAIDAKTVLKGNDSFKLTPAMEARAMADYAENTGTMSALTAEDIALDRELEAMAKDQPQVSDNGPVMEVKRTKDVIEHLREVVEKYTPASNMAELTEQVHVAKSEGCDSIDGTPTLVRQIFRKDYEYIEKNVGYGIYHDIRIYIDGYFDKHKGADSQTMEQRLFQGPKEAKKV